MAPVDSYAANTASSESTKKDLSSWWKNFKRGGEKRKEDEKHGESSQDHQEPQGIFGIPLAQSVRYANVAISLSDPNGQSYIYGYVPIVVAKCGVFLKEKATDVEGIFRLSGSEKRIKELRNAFNSPDRYGKGLDWTGYTVHDAANILRRYFNQLPEPIIPLDFYNHFRNPLRNHQSQAVGPMEGQSPSEGDFVVGDAIKTYQTLIKQLPPLNRQLLLYILDLLAVFASKADQNKMTTPNLAAIFQPGILSHPTHDMAPSEYRLSQDVLIFLIEHQDHFLIGMQGTAADEKTVQEVESGPPTPKHHSSKTATAILRSASNSSRYSGVRRSASASSRRSRGSVGPALSPAGSEPHTPTGGATGSGVHRSNTLPRTRSPNLSHGRFGKDSQPGNQTPPSIPEDSKTRPEQVARPILNTDSKLHSQSILQEVMTPSAEHSEQLPQRMNNDSMPGHDAAPKSMLASELGSRPTQNVQIPASTTVNKAVEQTSPQSAASNGSRPLSSFFSSKTTPDGRKLNKLQKKRSPLPSAHSSTHSLTEPDPVSMQSISGSLAHPTNLTTLSEHRPTPIDQLPLRTPPPIGDNFHGAGSPTTSTVSMSDADVVPGSDMLSASFDSRDSSHMESARKRHWFSRKPEGNQTNQQLNIGTNGQAGASRSSVLSSEGRKSMNIDGRRSINLDRIQSANSPEDPAHSNVSDAEREGRREKNPISWLKGKLVRDRSREGRRLVSPTRDPGLGHETQPLTGHPSQPSNISSVPESDEPVQASTANGASQHLAPQTDATSGEKKASTPDTIVPEKKEADYLQQSTATSITQDSKAATVHASQPAPASHNPAVQVDATSAENVAKSLQAPHSMATATATTTTATAQPPATTPGS